MQGGKDKEKVKYNIGGIKYLKILGKNNQILAGDRFFNVIYPKYDLVLSAK